MTCTKWSVYNFRPLENLEKAWTYTCVSDRCVRKHYLPGTKRTPFMSCAMVCGVSNIWPMPTGKLTLSSHSLTFNANQLEFNVKSSLHEAKELLMNAYDIFLYDLKAIAGESEEEHVDKTDNQIKNVEANTDTLKLNENCDINKIIISAEILTIGDVYLNLDMDESYELNVTSEFFFPYLSLIFMCNLSISSYSSLQVAKVM